MPVLDICYLFSQKDEAVLIRLGDIVLDEYNNSAYPVTTEALLIADERIATIRKHRD